MRNPICDTCHLEMDKGFMPDHYATVIQSVWHPGEAKEKTLFGNLKMDPAAQFPVTAYRCPQCGLLTLFAVKSE